MKHVRSRCPSDSRRGRHRSWKLLVPPSPKWVEVKMADLDGSSRVLLIYDANASNVLGHGLTGISTILPFTEAATQRPPMFMPPPAERALFGIMAVQESGLFVPEMGELVNLHWAFGLEWERSRSAWDALLYTLDHLHRRAFALPPNFLIPALFVAHMADQLREGSNELVVSGWGPVLDEVCRALDPLLQALYQYWIDGPSEADHDHALL